MTTTTTTHDRMMEAYNAYGRNTDRTQDERLLTEYRELALQIRLTAYRQEGSK